VNTATVAEMVKGNVEPIAERDAVLAWCEKNQGKVLRSNGIPEGFVIRREYGMTHLEPSNRQRSGAGFLLCHSDKGVLVPTPDELRARNACYYAARDERNAYRAAFLADLERVSFMQGAVDRVAFAVAEYRRAVAALQVVAGYPNPDHYALEELAGVIKEERQR